MTNTLTFTYTIELNDAEAEEIRRFNSVADDGTVTAQGYGSGLLGRIVSGHGLPPIYRNQWGEHQTTVGHFREMVFAPLPASIILA